MSESALKTARKHWKNVIGWCGRLPPGLRLAAGLCLVAGGVFGFLPILGFWMIPLGFAVMALDIKPMIHAVKKKRK